MHRNWPSKCLVLHCWNKLLHLTRLMGSWGDTAADMTSCRHIKLFQLKGVQLILFYFETINSDIFTTVFILCVFYAQKIKRQIYFNYFPKFYIISFFSLDTSIYLYLTIHPFFLLHFKPDLFHIVSSTLWQRKISLGQKLQFVPYYPQLWVMNIIQVIH